MILGHADLVLAQMDPGQPFHADLREIQKAAEHQPILPGNCWPLPARRPSAPRACSLKTR